MSEATSDRRRKAQKLYRTSEELQFALNGRERHEKKPYMKKKIRESSKALVKSTGHNSLHIILNSYQNLGLIITYFIRYTDPRIPVLGSRCLITILQALRDPTASEAEI